MCKVLSFINNFCLTIWITAIIIVFVSLVLCNFIIVNSLTINIFNFLTFVKCSWVAGYVWELWGIVVVLDELTLVVGLVGKFHSLDSLIHALLWWWNVSQKGCFWCNCQWILQKSCQFWFPKVWIQLTCIGILWKSLNYLTKSIERLVDFLHFRLFCIILIRGCQVAKIKFRLFESSVLVWFTRPEDDLKNLVLSRRPLIHHLLLT